MKTFTSEELQEHEDREEAIRVFLREKAKTHSALQKDHMPWFWEHAYLNSWDMLADGRIAVHLDCGTQTYVCITVVLPAQVAES